jgi:alpha-beta hydrolase superfamily lysophospholipase
VTLAPRDYRHLLPAIVVLHHQGHDFTEGRQGHLLDINPVLNDYDTTHLCALPRRLPAHAPLLPLLGLWESLGDANMLLLHLQNRDLWRYRAMLNDTMCGVSPRIKPPWALEHLLAAVVPTWHVAFTRGNILESFFKVEWKRALMLASSRRTTAPPRAAMVLERLRICCEMQHRFEEVQLSLLGVHGAEDTVCNPACVEELYRHAGSKDKTLCVYLGM